MAMISSGLTGVCLALAAAVTGPRPARLPRRAWLYATGVLALAVLGLALVPGNYGLRHVVGECLMTAGLVWLGLAAVAAALWRRRERGPALVATTLWGLYSLAGNALVGDSMLSLLERPYARLDPRRQGRFDAVLVLGGGATSHDDGTASLTAVGQRVVLAVEMYRAGQVDTLVTSGPTRRLPAGRVASDPAATVQIWADLGVPVERTAKLEGTRTTSDEIPAFAALVRASGWRRVGVISSAWHLRRAMRLAARAGLEATPLPAGRNEDHTVALRWLVPQEAGFREVQCACWELLGMLAGR